MALCCLYSLPRPLGGHNQGLCELEMQHFRQETATLPALGRQGSVGHAKTRIRLVLGRE